MNKRESLENQLVGLTKEAEFYKKLKAVFDSPDGVEVFDWIMKLGNFGGIIKGDFACGRYAVSSQIWADIVKAAPEVIKAWLNLQSENVFKNRQEQFKQIEHQLKEVDDEQIY
ncbi:MAG: hypothetical protein DRH26_11725 [Deltaproteobacteria bacterium]|nr:MAG: hypothetical protein DRH26_11725 [Deltaproteobacteria bacterium]